MKKLALNILLFISVTGYAQVTLRGTIRLDSSNTGISKVNISIAELNAVTQSNESGSYQFKNLPRGRFTVMYKLLGYQTKVLLVNVDDSVTVKDVSLEQSFLQYPEVVVYGTNNSASEKTANTISQLDVIDMRSSGAMNLSDGIAKIPGISQLTTGSGISKPVIRGLYGNRIQTVLYGLRFDNQQWQDEHGLGLSDVGIDRVEIIKGAASLLYGSEAMGGVINIIEEKSAPVNTVKADFSTRFFSNTAGIGTDVGVKGASQKFNWRVRAGMDSHADYTDGNNKRILNSRFGGYYAKAGFGYNGKRWINVNNYMFTQSNFGFIMDPIQFLDQADDRYSRSFDRPHHTVNLNIFSTQNTFFLKRESKLKVNLGFQNNNRQEQEGGNKISLNMRLRSIIGNMVYTKLIRDKIEFNIGTQDFYQTNLNLGSRTIIPDATTIESSAYTYVKGNFTHIVVEGGLRYDYRSIQTFTTGTINTDTLGPGSKIRPFSRSFNAVNGSLGLSWFDNKHFTIKSNFSTGYRSGNLAELSSNGLHEGTYRYEIGNTNMKIEQNMCTDLNLFFKSSFINLSAAGYYNHFLNYIFLAPSDKEYLGFRIYNYEQRDANISGVEFTSDIHPKKLNWFNWISSYSYIYGRVNDSTKYLPFIAAPKLNSDLKFSFKNSKKISEITFKPGVTYVFRQDRPAAEETATADYYLVNASASMTIKNKRNIIQISVAGNNLLNNAYYDHLSRFKYYGVYNIGRNVSMNFKISF